MKNGCLLLIALLLSFCPGKSIQAGDSTRFNLTLDGLIPKPGAQTEKTVIISEAFSFTNMLNEHPSITNSTLSLDLKFKDKILIWDETNDYAKVEMVVDHFLYTHENKTNELVKAGTRLWGTFINGEWFFQSSDRHLTDRTAQSLGKIYVIHPRSGIKDYDCLKLNQPRFAGESWKTEFSKDLTKLDGLDNSASSYFARLIASGLNSNNVESTAQFVGTTNVSGFNCFHLFTKTNVREQMKILDFSAETRLDIIMPFDTAHPFWMKSGSIDGWILPKDVKNGTNAIPVRGKVSAKLVVECRDISQN